MEIPTLRESTCKRKVAFFRSMMARSSVMTRSERTRLVEEMQVFCESLSTGTMALGGAGIGLSAAILPVIGVVTGPLIGGVYGVYKASKLSRYRDEVLSMIELLASGDS